jgi:hypothetical protein
MRTTHSWLTAILISAACTSSTTTSAPDAPGGGDGPPSSPDAAAVTSDGGTSYSCPQSIDAYCVPPVTCIRNFGDVPTCGRLSGTESCGIFDAFVMGGVDTARTSYYDAAGHLVAIIDFALGHLSCTAGPSTFVAPACGDLHPIPACADAGP